MSSKYEYNILVFDIETIPQEKLTIPLQEELERKIGNEMARTLEEAEQVKLRIQSINPAFGKIFCIGVLYKIMNLREEWMERSEIFYSEDEHQILRNFWKRLSDFDSRRTLFVSFNGLSFDVPFIIVRSIALGLQPRNQSFLDTYRYGRFPHVLRITFYIFLIKISLAECVSTPILEEPIRKKLGGNNYGI